MGRKEELGRELNDASRETADNVARAEQIRDERNAEIDVIDRIPADLDPDDLAAITKAGEGIRRESDSDFERNAEAKQRDSEATLREVSSQADQERTKVERGESDLDRIGGNYGRSDIASARTKLESSARLLEDLSDESSDVSERGRESIDQARSDMR